MKVNDVEFKLSATTQAHWPKDRLPAIAFAGRSNVGKSSLINTTLNRKGVMRVSKTPGRTQSLNFLLVNRRFYFVDLPGYGYAKVPLSIRSQWGPMINRFLSQSEMLRAVVHILDIRHKPTQDDMALLDWLESLGMPTIPVLTKADKLTANQIQNNVKMISEYLELPREAFTIFSAETGRGRDELWGRIETALSADEPPQ
jgi:GTP-binding protein